MRQNPLTLEEIAKHFGVSRTRIQQILQNAIFKISSNDRLRNRLFDYYLGYEAFNEGTKPVFLKQNSKCPNLSRYDMDLD